MWIIIKFYNIIIKSANADKGGGGNAYPQNVDKNTCVFLTPPLVTKTFHDLFLNIFYTYLAKQYIYKL